MALLKIKVFLAQDCADSRVVFEALPLQLMGWSYCAQYWQVHHGQVLRNLNRFECEQMFQGGSTAQVQNELQLRPDEGDSNLVVERTPTIVLQGELFTGAKALEGLCAYLQKTLL